MAKVAITQDYLQDIADAIRTKTGLSSTYYPSEMAQAILSISGSGGITPTGTINITTNGTHNVTQYASANVQVPTSASPSLQSKSVTIIPSLSTQEQTVSADSGYDGLSSVNITTNPVATGAVQNPVATKGTVSNHSISITPSVSYSTGYVTGNTKTGTAVSVSASQLVSGTLSITSNGTKDVTNYVSVNVNVSGSSTPSLQDKTVSITPTTSSQSQTVTADSGYDGLDQVTINTAAVPTMTLPSSAASSATSGYTSKATIGRSTSDQYINIPTGYNSAGAYYKVSAVANGSVTAPSTISGTSATVSTGTNTLTLTKTVSVTPNVTTAGYISSGTAGNASVSLTASVNTRSSSDLTASGAAVTAPAGYYASAATKSISTGSATTPSSISGTAAALSTGTNTLTLTKTVSVTPTVSAGYISAGTAGNSSVSLTANVTTKAAATITPGTTNQTIASGTYLTGTQTIAGDADLVAGNIKSGVSIFGVTGTYEGSGGGGGDLTVATATAQGTGTTYINFPVAGNPTSFVVIAQNQLTVDSTAKAAAVSFDGTNCYADMVTNTSNAQVTYNAYAYRQYSDGNLSVVLDTMTFPSTVTYKLIYTYNGTSSDVHTAETQVGSGATSISFTGLVGQPTYWSVVFKSNFSTSSGYQRVIAAANDGSTICGLAMDSSAHPSTTYWNDSYNNGTLTISSQGTNAGGYFHQPGYYQLIYVTGAESETPSITVEPLNVTTNGTYTAPSGTAYSPVTVNVSGSSVSYDTKTVTASNYPVSLAFTSMKGQPKFFTVRLNAQVSSSGNTTYYYIVNITSNGTTTHGNCFRIGSTRRIENITSGYSYTYSGTTLTITSSAASRSASPGAFYSGSYELMYAY